MNRRSFLALAASPLLAPLLASCRALEPAKSYSLKPYGPPPVVIPENDLYFGRLPSAEQLMAEIEEANAKMMANLFKETPDEAL